jgi:hypothetical protein
MRKFYFLITCILLLSFQQQKKTNQKYSGYHYLLSNGIFIDLKYTKSYSTSDEGFVTTYKVYHPTKGTLLHTVTATHKKEEKKVEVISKEAHGGILADENLESITYKEPSINPFGRNGDARSLGGNGIPYALKVIFTSNKFEYVKVCQVCCSTANGTLQFFVLEDKLSK